MKNKMSVFQKRIKEAAVDAELPETRKKLFAEIFKNDFFLLVDVSLAEALFSLPLAAILSFGYVSLTSVTASFENVFPIVLYVGLAAVLGRGIKYIGRNASFALMKKRAHGEGFFVTAAVFTAVGEGFKKSFAAGVVVGLSALICALGSTYLIYFSDSFLKWAGVGFCILQFVVAFGAAEYLLAAVNFYELSFFAALKNGYSLAIAGFPATFLHFVYSVGIKCLAAVFSPFALIAAAILFALGGNGLTALSATLYAHSAFDKYVNAEHYPEYVGKGLKKKDK